MKITKEVLHKIIAEEVKKAKDALLNERRRPSMDVLELQTLLKQHFGDRINLGNTGKNKDGVDGVYGKKTQAAINLLRRTSIDAPKRDRSFKKSVRNLIDYLKRGVQQGKRIEKLKADEIANVLKNMNLIASVEDANKPEVQQVIKGLLKLQNKGQKLDLKTIKMAGKALL